MRRLAFTLLALAALLGPAAAQLGTGLPECDRRYKEFWSRAAAGKELTGGQLATVHRYALRAYDGCTSGDEHMLSGDFLNRLAGISGANADEALRDIGRALTGQ